MNRSELFIQIETEKIDMLTRIIEAHGHLGVVSTLDRTRGLVIIRGTSDTIPEIEAVLSFLPFPFKVLEQV